MHDDTEPSLPGASAGANGNGSDPTSTGARHRSAAAAASSSAPSAGAGPNTSSTSGSGGRAANITNSNSVSVSASGPGTGILSKLLLLITLVLKIVLYPLRKASTWIFPPGPYDGLSSKSSSDRAARDFVSMLRRHLGTANAAAADPFSTEGYRTTLTEIAGGQSTPPSSSSSSPLLLIYIHSKLHPDCSKFCEKTLAQTRLVGYLNESSSRRGGVRCFGACTDSADGTYLAKILGAAAFPFLCLVNVKSSGGGGGTGSSNNSSSGSNANVTLEVKLKMQGRKLVALHADTLLAYIQTVVRQHGAAMAEVEARRLQREEEARLRREQDREYREALEADRAREAAQREEREREEAERRVMEEAKRREEEEKQDILAKAMSLVSEEPGVGTPDAARVRMALPNGRRIDRRFKGDDTIEVVRAFLTIHFHENDIGITNFSLSTSFPKRTYDDLAVTLKQGDLVPQAVLMVQDLDA